MIFKTDKHSDRRYRFKELKVYNSTEWLANGEKRYHKTLESCETSYVYAELSLFNKFFDQRDWSVRVRLKCYRIEEGEKEELCDLALSQTIKKEDAIVYIREGWGHEEKGYYWKRGDYLWEAYVDDVLEGTVLFYIENGGPVEDGYNPYFEVEALKLYEGGKEGVPPLDREYCSQFNGAFAKYIWAEFKINNLQHIPWFCEVVFNFYNQEGNLKGSATELKRIDENSKQIEIVTGWGAEAPGTWHEGYYRVEVVFMGYRQAVLPFFCGKQQVAGMTQFVAGNEINVRVLGSSDLSMGQEDSIEEIMQELNAMVGLESIKQKVKEYIDYLAFLKIREERGFEEQRNLNLHSVFKGNPGTGKTSVARLMARIFHRMGFLSKGTVTEVGRAELIGQYIGQTAPKVKETIEKARGGVLFIDEAYALVRNEEDDKDFGREVIEVLVKEMSDGAGDIAIFVAGHTDGMEQFLNSNPGLKSRFRMLFDFPDYMPQELVEIGESVAVNEEVELSEDARQFMKKKLVELYRNRDKTFGNARLVQSIVEEAKLKMALRVMRHDMEEVDEQMLKQVEKEDVVKIFEENKIRLPDIGIDEKLLQESLSMLNQLIGLQGVKRDLDSLVKLVRFYKESGKDVLGRFSLHSVFKGNPGTGKTTVARILSQIYKALGILERGHLVECSRQDLVAGYVGQTAIKTNEMIEKARGGVLFIDEAYALSGGGQASSDYGKEAIEVLLKEMEDKRGEFIVVVAGYTDQMQKFLSTNPGLKSRFDKELYFTDFEMEELYQIAEQLLKKEDLFFTEKAEEHFKFYLNSLYKQRDQYFGNGRDVRKIISKVIKNQHLRMSDIPYEERTEEILRTVDMEDVKEFYPGNEELLIGVRGIGFNY
ncbi:AAA family ATPase [Limibacter armeniacum]|uniref:AAA family ATPase n=1 Tax=Limibacter armeniacum TaxID=466084 RepID=UPI002FE60F25